MGPSLWTAGILEKEGEERMQESERVKTLRDPGPRNQIKLGSYGLTETELAAMEPAWVCTRFFVYILRVFAWSFVGSRSMCVSDTFTSSWDSFPFIGLSCRVLIRRLLTCLIVSCFVVFDCYLLETCPFQGKAWWVDLTQRGYWGDWKE